MKEHQVTTFKFPQMLVMLFIALISWYTYATFFINTNSNSNTEDLLFYFAPSIIMLIIFITGRNHEKIEGSIILLTSIIFLLIYNVYVSIAAFLYLIFTGITLLVDSKKTSNR